MLFEETEVTSGVRSVGDEHLESENPYDLFLQMEELFEKFKLINYDYEFIKQLELRPLNRHYFAIQTNPGEQFFIFSSLSAWLIRKCGLEMDFPQEYDDPNSTLAFIMDSVRNLGIIIDFPASKLRQGYGRNVVKLLGRLCDYVLHTDGFKFLKPIIPIETNDEELVTEDNAELLLERIEEEMGAEENGSEDDEDVFLHVDDLRKLNHYPKKMDETIQTNITQDEWLLEVERVLPSLRLIVKTDSRNWRNDVELIKNYRVIIGNTMQLVRSRLYKLGSNILETRNKISSREHFLNLNLDNGLIEYRSVQEQFCKINNRYRELNIGIMERERKLIVINTEIDSMKREMQDLGEEMSDGSNNFTTPVINLKKGLVNLREDVANMNIQIAILQHDILHLKLREKILMQQKLHSQFYA